MLASEFDYHLPKKLIAQKPASPRERARLMVLDRVKDTLSHERVKDLPSHFENGDVIVVNDTKVFRARLRGRVGKKGAEGRKAEVLLVRTVGDAKKFPLWRALAKPGRAFLPGSVFAVNERFFATVVGKEDDGAVLLDFRKPKGEVIHLSDAHGEVPLPPYIAPKGRNAAGYQTVYAKKEGSVAAPTAGFHLTKGVLSRLEKKGVSVVSVTLHVGVGTFTPIRSKQIEEHVMHSEWVDIPDRTALEVLKAKAEGRRVIAVGTTTLRALEGAVEKCGGEICPWHGDVDLYVTPGFQFKVVDALLTNFHLPRSTLLVLVSSFSGRKKVKRAYEEAVKRKYRFYSFGDAMLIV